MPNDFARSAVKLGLSLVIAGSLVACGEGVLEEGRGDDLGDDLGGGDRSLVAPGSIWISSAELMNRPTSGAAWETVQRAAVSDWGAPNIKDQTNSHDLKTLAGALYATRKGDASMRRKVRDALLAARETENGGRVLALAWNLTGYVLAADIIDLKAYDPSADQAFRIWLQEVRREPMTECGNLVACSESRPNNWGTHALASRIAADLYLGDTTDLARAVKVFRGYLGDRSQYAGFKYGELSWQCDPERPVGINPKGCARDGLRIDGVLPDDQRRGGTFTTRPPRENYVYTALQGAVAAAAMLHRAGHPAFEWSDRAIVRALEWTHDPRIFGTPSFTASDADDRWIADVVNAYAGAAFPTFSSQATGRNLTYADFTHPKGVSVAPTPSEPGPSTPSPTEPEAAVRLSVRAVSASAHDGNLPARAVDGDLGTRWSAYGDGQWIALDLGQPRTLRRVRAAFYLGDTRTQEFDVEVSGDGALWKSVYVGRSSGTDLGLESFDLAVSAVRYVRLVGHGNSRSLWNSFTEIELWGR